ncbi:protein FAM204A isoform X2 [Biomphalaria glabrata]|nr:protein FAM204A isoform X2 [Biomphalaria glabrata]
MEPSSGSDYDIHSEAAAPKNVSKHLWEKFKLLEKRTDETTRRSTEKRIKHLQKQVLETVTSEFTSPCDKDILRKYDVKFGPPVEKETKRKKRKHEDTNLQVPSCTSQSDQLKDIVPLLTVNDHIQKDLSRPPPPTALEKHIDDAIRLGDVQTAECLSDHLATRELGEKIVAAIDAKKFLEQKKVDEALMKSKKKKKLPWGFEPKQRWETKGNM